MEFGRTASLDNKTEAFFERGFAVLPDAVEPALLARMQAAWTRKSEVMEPLWRQRVATNASSNPRGKPGRFESRVSPRAFDMPTADFFSGDDGRVLLEVVALPSVVELLERVVAPRPGLRLCGVQARTVVPQPAEAVGGYTNCVFLHSRLLPRFGTAAPLLTPLCARPRRAPRLGPDRRLAAPAHAHREGLPAALRRRAQHRAICSCPSDAPSRGGPTAGRDVRLRGRPASGPAWDGASRHAELHPVRGKLHDIADIWIAVFSR
eukprot:COSAG04_NODE_5696_length_1522_cov_4.678145_2_plen_264_part_00